MNSSLTPVILCGGSGTRLWPLSREAFPKQFLALTGDGISMLQATAKRLDGLDSQIPKTAPIVVCSNEHRFLAAQQLHEANIADAKLVLEPFSRNTAPALTLAALIADPDAVMLALPADHSISNLEPLQEAIRTAWHLARDGAVVTFGVVPNRAEIGYGYIKKAEKVGESGAFNVDTFNEKPSLEVAESYVESGSYLWNSGIFMVRVGQWLKAMATLQPSILTACESAVQQSNYDMDFIRPECAEFSTCPSDSIDYAVMEHLPGHRSLDIPVYVVPLDAGWSDLGAWDALWDLMERDDNGNAHVGNTVCLDTHNSLIFSESRLVATLGVESIVVVETPDAVLVVDKRRTQDVKKVVEKVKIQRHALAHSHRKVHRPWGWYDSVDSGSRFQVKRIVVNPGAQLSLQMHHHRAEHWIVVRGTAQVTKGDETFLLGENESTFIPLGHIHRLSNPGKLPLEIIEVQSGAYLGEDDIVRIQSDY